MGILEEWYPVTSDMGLVNADCATILQSGFFSDIFATDKEVTSSLGVALENLLPLSIEKKRALFVPTRSNWTAYFASGIHAGSRPWVRLCSSGHLDRVFRRRSLVAVRPICSADCCGSLPDKLQHSAVSFGTQSGSFWVGGRALFVRSQFVYALPVSSRV